MRPLADLLSEDPAWPLVRSWVEEATNQVVVLPAPRERGEHALHALQVTSRSTLGAVTLETAGILVDHGWLRLLGAGDARMTASLVSWNKVGDPPLVEPLERALLVGYDAVAGFFALDGGEFGGDLGHVHYLAPDTLEWESLERGYSDFLRWALTGDLAAFFASSRWPGWREDLAGASPDTGFSVYPPPFLAEHGQRGPVRRMLVPMVELWNVQRDYARQLAGVPEGTRVETRVRE